jgi:hypothetical protein
MNTIPNDELDSFLNKIDEIGTSNHTFMYLKI